MKHLFRILILLVTVASARGATVANTLTTNAVILNTNTIYVDLSGSDSIGNGTFSLPYKTLTNAVAHLGSNQCLIVGEGTWYTTNALNIKRGASISGRGPLLTRIRGDQVVIGENRVIIVGTNSVVSDLSISTTNGATCILMTDPTNVLVHNVRMEGYYDNVVIQLAGTDTVIPTNIDATFQACSFLGGYDTLNYSSGFGNLRVRDCDFYLDAAIATNYGQAYPTVTRAINVNPYVTLFVSGCTFFTTNNGANEHALEFAGDTADSLVIGHVYTNAIDYVNNSTIKASAAGCAIWNYVNYNDTGGAYTGPPGDVYISGVSVVRGTNNGITRIWNRSDGQPMGTAIPLATTISVMNTNVGTAGVIPANQVTVTNLTGNITISGISGLESCRWNTTILFCKNSSGADRTVTVPAAVQTADGLRTWTVTNNSARTISLVGVGLQNTNGASVPNF